MWSQNVVWKSILPIFSVNPAKEQVHSYWSEQRYVRADLKKDRFEGGQVFISRPMEDSNHSLFSEQAVPLGERRKNHCSWWEHSLRSS